MAAHPRTTKGAIVSAAPTRLTIRVTDAATKKTSEMAFEIDAETKIYRGTKVVTFAEAAMQPGEPVSVTVDLDVAEDLADAIRLDAKTQ
jgi:hypothetical protein